MFQARRRENIETYLPATTLPNWSDTLWLVRHFLAEKLLQFRVWSLQHVMEKDGHMGSCWLSIGECRSICIRGLDPPWSYNSRVHKNQLSSAYVPKHILLQLRDQADKEDHGRHSSFKHIWSSSPAFHKSVANEPVDSSFRCSSPL